MSGLSQKEKEALELFKERLVLKFPGKFNEIKLYGSKARGEATKESDIDIFVLFQNADWKDERDVIAAATDISLETGVYPSAKVYTVSQLEQMKSRRSMFWQSISKDLVDL